MIWAAFGMDRFRICIGGPGGRDSGPLGVPPDRRQPRCRLRPGEFCRGPGGGPQRKSANCRYDHFHDDMVAAPRDPGAPVEQIEQMLVSDSRRDLS